MRIKNLIGRYIPFITGLIAIVAVISPILITLDSRELDILVYLLLLNTFGWCSVIILTLYYQRLSLFITKFSELLGIPGKACGVPNKVAELIEQVRRYQSTSNVFKIDKAVTENNLGLNLRQIVELAYTELPVTSVELALFDEMSGLWSQAILLGSPFSSGSQAMLTEVSNTDPIPPLRKTNIDVLVQPLTFAGTLFGALRVEIIPGRNSTESDKRILASLAVQGALMLLNAKFSDQLLKMHRAGEESIRAKTGFLANLSHEIRGPLGIILNGVELMVDGLCGPVTEAQNETLGLVKQNGDHLLELVNDVLDYARVEAGKVTVKPAIISVKHLLEDLLLIIRSQAEQKKHVITLEPVDSALGVLCDKRHARQMLINFLTNAVKYSPVGGKITLNACRIAANKIKISVSDTGVGIPEDQKNKVFGAFERIEHKYSSAQTGTGLGMPLTRKLAEVNNGTVDFESSTEKGSTFWVILPAAEITTNIENTSEITSNKINQGSGKGESILLVDNENDGRSVIERYLIHQGFQVITTSSGANVFKLLKEKPIDIAIVENELPDITGEEIVAGIRATPRASAIPIILLSAKAFIFDIERFLKLGVDRCLSKPVELRDVAHTVRQLIDESKLLENTKN